MKFILKLILVFVFISCSDTDEFVNEEVYFPPNDSDNWENISHEQLQWNTAHLNNLYDYLENNDTRGFIVLINGKIAIEKYWGNNILNTSSFDKNTNWYWASAGKTLTAALVGIAEEDGLLSLTDKTSTHLGNGWTSLSIEKENLITIKSQLSMTTGLDYNIEDLYCTLPECLDYKVDADNQWYYHNAPYTLLHEVINAASQTDINNYTHQKIETKIGIDGQWIPNGFNTTYWSTARDMARFGHLILNNGKWISEQIIPENYVEKMINTSQTINPSYGYLWWLNGKDSIIMPGLETSFNFPLSANAPNDLVAGMGKNGQFVEIIPSKKMVVIRMGDSSNEELVPLSFHNTMWFYINQVIEN